ncbi:hypothetical protein Sango_1176100 [Sesamum angolense]|uniref:Integrase catalytic domain-containing protein n=1 Tax=Sesamum angolense TaxID=2727404 RepID=A0AAE2BX51_9LAMI|nr:hypothetical protein Sango_1176100 [Sesamum angolense]
MVIRMDIANFIVHKVLVDNGSSADIIFKGVLRKLGLEGARLDPVHIPLVKCGPDGKTSKNQKKRSFGVERNRIVEEELNKLLEVGYMSEVLPIKGLLTGMFKELIGVSMEVNVDDMLVKNRRSDDHLIHLKQAFEVMRTNGMKLNPIKCTFGVGGGKLPDYLVRERGIEANPGKIEAIMKLVPPKTIKETQRLMGVWELGQGWGQNFDTLFRKLWKPLKGKVSSIEDRSIMLLLADYSEGCNGVYQKMRKLSKIHITNPYTDNPYGIYQGRISFRLMGDRHFGTISPTPAQKKFIILAVEYYSKWVEVEALAKFLEKEVMKNIICRIDIPRSLISDNGAQFQGKRIVAWCKTPFHLVYGTEAIIPIEIGEETQRIAGYDPKNCRAERAFDLVTIEEKTDQTYAKILHQKGLMMKSYNHKVSQDTFK